MNRTKLSIHVSNSTFVPNLVAAKMTDYDFNKNRRNGTREEGHAKQRIHLNS